MQHADLELALAIADECDRITLAAFSDRGLEVGWKPDGTEVTAADRAAETLIVERIATARPQHAVLGEEFGLRGDPAAPQRWLVDPIDGTSGFARRIPVWATLLALTDPEGVAVAVVSAPALGRRWWAARGVGAFASGARCRVSDVTDLADAQVSITLNDGWDALGRTDALVALGRSARRVRGFGDFWQHCLVAEGAIDVAVDAVGVSAYDLAAPRLIVEEAGGRFTDRLGEPTHTHDTAVSTNALLHDQVIARLA
ncbi:MAG: histidinol phosphatase [Ilumatobacteraceae bacterium]|nr:histidinol phosphatase [Ilumatobacteraceae bacterium]